MCAQKNGVSALGLQRVLGLGSYQTAWVWLHKLRRAMVRPDREPLGGPGVSVDRLAAAVAHVSKCYFSRCFADTYGETASRP